MVVIAHIKLNKCEFPDMGKYALDLLHTNHTPEKKESIIKSINDYIISVIKDYVDYVDVDIDDLILTSCYKLTERFNGTGKNVASDFYYNTELSYSFPKSYLEIMTCTPSWREYPHGKKETMNCLGCLFSLQHNIVDGDCIILANEYPDDGSKNVKLVDTTQADILRVVRRRFFLSAIMVIDGKFTKYYYQNPIQLVNDVFDTADSPDNMLSSEVNLFGYKLTMYFMKGKYQKLNKTATRINGDFQIYGNVLFFHRIEDNVHANLSMREFRRLSALGYGRKCDRYPKEGELDDVDEEYIDDNGNFQTRKVTPLKNRYIILSARIKKYNEHRNKCVNCGCNIRKLVICEKCHRMKYCSIECKKENYTRYHDEDCVKNI